MGDSLYSTGDFRTVTASETEFDIADLPRAIRVGGAGNVFAVNVHGDTVPFYGCSPGEVLEIRARRITAATTATDLVGYW